MSQPQSSACSFGEGKFSKCTLAERPLVQEESILYVSVLVAVLLSAIL